MSQHVLFLSLAQRVTLARTADPQIKREFDYVELASKISKIDASDHCVLLPLGLIGDQIRRAFFVIPHVRLMTEMPVHPVGLSRLSVTCGWLIADSVWCL